MMDDFKTPDKAAKLRIKPGHIAVHNKWKNSDVLSSIKVLFNGVTMGDLGDFDFTLTEMNFIYFPEAKLVSGINVEHIISLHGTTFIADRNSLTVDIFSQIQIELSPFGINLLPVGNRGEVALLVHQLYLSQVLESPGSSFRIPTKSTPGIQMQMLLTVPGLGRTKANKLLDHFGTVEKVISASQYSLEPVVGSATAAQVYKFFNCKADFGGK